MADQRPVFFFDIDNCLYPKSSKVGEHLVALINKYSMDHLHLTKEDAYRLNREYYKTYGLAVEGLVRHHKIDPMDFNKKVDDALPLESILSPNPKLQRLLGDFDKKKVKLWLFTNAYVNHAKRVTRILEVDSFFDGLTFCDYSELKLVCKPDIKSFEKAMSEAGISKFEDCYFVDDSELNCKRAEELGWTAIHLKEDETVASVYGPCKYQIKDLEELRALFPQFMLNN